jgi:hypothetical protein
VLISPQKKTKRVKVKGSSFCPSSPERKRNMRRAGREIGGGEVHHAQDFQRVFILEYNVFWIEKYFFFHYNKLFQCFPIDDDPLFFFSSELLKDRKTFIRKEIPF